MGPYDVSKDQQSSLHWSFSGSKAKSQCQQRLLLAAIHLGKVIQQAILDKTGFTTTLGISINALSEDSMFFRFPILVQGKIPDWMVLMEDMGVSVRRGVDQLLHRQWGLDAGDYGDDELEKEKKDV